MDAKAIIEVLDGGLQTTVQDYPGRHGLLARGFFPSGPVDDFAFRAANLLVGNETSAAGLEVTLGRLRVRFHQPGVVALAGAAAPVALNDREMPMWRSFAVAAGDELRIGMSKGPGFRIYVGVAGGVDVPGVLGSRSTYTVGGIGGLDGRGLIKGDTLPVGRGEGQPNRCFRSDLIPCYTHEWEIEVMRGPQADPDFLTAADFDAFLNRAWPVDHNSNRVGVRLGQIKLQWARATGGVAGGHPSNILDNGYPLAGVNMNGDLPVILTPDGPTAGGFVVFATVVRGARWKLGQLRPGVDRIRFKEVEIEDAVGLARQMNSLLTEESLEVC